MRAPLPISSVAKYDYCPRHFWLSHAAEEVEDLKEDESLERGIFHHSEIPDFSHRKGVHRSVSVFSDTYRIAGIVDQVEIHDDGSLTLVEHKSSENASVQQYMVDQLSLYALCLREQGYEIREGAVIFPGNDRKTVPLDLADLDRADNLARDMHEVVESADPPERLSNSSHQCLSCSRQRVCKPYLSKTPYINPRRVVHLTGDKGSASLSKGRIRVCEERDSDPIFIPLGRVESLDVQGNFSVSSALIREVLSRGGTVTWSSGSGYFVGGSLPYKSPNGATRQIQYSMSETNRVSYAREISAAKVENQRVLLRRKGVSGVSLKYMSDAKELIAEARTRLEVHSGEGLGASVYFRHFAELASASDKELLATWKGRNGRGALDPINVLLNYGYGYLLRRQIHEIVSAGLDPYNGFLHTTTRNAPALALDLMEQFRTPIVDSVVLTLLNNGQIRHKGFVPILNAYKMTDATRKILISRLNDRMCETVSVPKRRTPISYGGALEIYTRSFLDFCRTGELSPGFTWR